MRPALASFALLLPLLGLALPACDRGAGDEHGSGSHTGEAQHRPAAGEPQAPDFPDPYSAPAVGITLSKPPGWFYLPQTNHPDPMRYTKRLPFDQLREVITDIFTPLVAMSPRRDARPGEAPIVSVYFRYALEPIFVQYQLRAHPEKVADANIVRFRQRPGFEVLEPPALTDLGGQPGAVTRIRYVEVDAESGAEHPVQLRIWNTKRDWGYFYVEALMPEPVSPQTEAEVESLVASLHLERPMTIEDVGGKPKPFEPPDLQQPGGDS